eukprot:10405619-Heterocapsa_arctica.AAC.1
MQEYKILITNVKHVEDAIGLLCEGVGPTGVCSRIALARYSWQPKVVDGKIVHFPSSDATEYPAGLCELWPSPTALGRPLRWRTAPTIGSSSPRSSAD